MFTNIFIEIQNKYLIYVTISNIYLILEIIICIMNLSQI